MTRLKGESPASGAEADVETRLLDAASDLFAERGYAAVGIREIAKRAGVTVGALYHYAASKEALFVSLLRRSYGRLMPQIREAVAADASPSDRIRGLARAHIVIEVEQADLWRVSRAELNLLGADSRAEVVSLRDEFEAIWDEIVADGVARGEFTVHDPRLARLCLVELCNGVGTWYHEGGRLSLDQIIDEVSDYALALLRSG